MTKQEKLKAALAKDIRNVGNGACVKRHPYGKFDYVPIGILKRLFSACFGHFQEEIISMDKITAGDSVVFTIHLRVHFFNPLTGKDMFLDGIGSASHQGKQDIVMTAPKAKSEAFKNAVTDYAPLFGQNLRKKPGTDGKSIHAAAQSIFEYINS